MYPLNTEMDLVPTKIATYLLNAEINKFLNFYFLSLPTSTTSATYLELFFLTLQALTVLLLLLCNNLQFGESSLFELRVRLRNLHFVQTFHRSTRVDV